jgi:hypothetical protein
MPIRFDEKLVLNRWTLGLFDKKKFDQLAVPPLNRAGTVYLSACPAY